VAIDFPSSPTLDELFVDAPSSTSYRWDGKRWASLVNAAAAFQIDYDGSTSGLSSDDVQGAIDELSLGGQPLSAIVNFTMNPRFYVARRGTSFLVSDTDGTVLTMDRWEARITDAGEFDMQIDQVQLPQFQGDRPANPLCRGDGFASYAADAA